MISGSSSRGHRWTWSDYKARMVDRNKFKDTIPMRMDTLPVNVEGPSKQNTRKKGYQRKDFGGSKKYPVKSYIAESKSEMI